MNTRNYVLILLTVIIAALISGPALGAETPVLKATLLRYDPTPAQPGEYITAYVQIENIGGKATKNARIEFIDSYPFSMDDPQEKRDDIGVLGAGQAYVTDFKIRVNEGAVEGTNPLKFQITDDYTSNIFIEKIFNVNVQTHDADIGIEKIRVTPPEIEPGGKARVSITLKNTADSTLKDISISLLFYSAAGGKAVDLPFAIEDSISKKTVKRLDSMKNITFEYPIRSYATVKPGVYKIPLAWEFFDGTGQKYNKTDFITLIVNPQVNLYVTIESSELTKESKIGDVVFRIVNRGFGEIKLTNLRLLPSKDYELLTPYTQAYIGNIDTDDYETAEFKIMAKSDSLSIPYSLDYKDSLNTEHVMAGNLTLKVYSAKDMGNSKSNFWPIVIALAIAAGAGYWIYRRMKKKK